MSFISSFRVPVSPSFKGLYTVKPCSKPFSSFIYHSVILPLFISIRFSAADRLASSLSPSSPVISSRPHSQDGPSFVLGTSRTPFSVK